MRINKQVKNSSSVSASRKAARKAPGTRMGTLEDWRGASGNSGKSPNERRNALRDGR